MIALSIIAVIYVGLVAMVQQDMKKLVAYSSVAHMGFVTLGFFIFNPLGVAGGLVQMIAHGFVSGAMFLCIGVLYDRMHSREIADYGGVVNRMPKFAAFSVLFAQFLAGLSQTAFEGDMDSRVAAEAKPESLTRDLAYSASVRAMGGALSVRLLPMVVATPAIGLAASASALVLGIVTLVLWAGLSTAPHLLRRTAHS